MGFSWQEYWSGLQPFLQCTYVVSELSTMTHPSWVALHSTAHSLSYASPFATTRLWSMKGNFIIIPHKNCLSFNCRENISCKQHNLLLQLLNLIPWAKINWSLIPGLGRSPGEGNGYPLQYSCLENSMERGTWEATVHLVAKCWTQLSD